MTMIRKIAAVLMLLIVLSAFALPAMASGGNGGSSGADGAGSSGSGGSGNGGGSAGPSGDAPGGPSGPQAQPLQEEQERSQQETIDQPGIQITQHDRDQTQGRTGVDPDEPASADLARQRDRDAFLQQVSMHGQNVSRDRARVDIALYAIALSGNVTGSSGPELARLGAEIANSSADAHRAELQIAARSSVSRMLFGGDREAAGLLVQYADQNRQRIQEMEQLLMNCSDCDPQVRVMLEEQVQVLAEEQNRLRVLGQQEQGDRGLFGWLFR